jgi:tetratricopeptide (TPR) repeat protein
MRCALPILLSLGLAATPAAQSSELEALERATEASPMRPGVWYALGQAYNAIKQNALRTFDNPSDDSSWRQLLFADTIRASGKFTEAFTLYRAVLERLPAMVTIHDSIAWIYEQTGHPDWAARERAAGMGEAADCARRAALCDFRAGRYRAALTAAMGQTDPESRYLLARAANELALVAFRRLDALADSPERRAVRATVARAEERYTDAIAELTAALAFVPDHPTLLYELASAFYQARDYDRAVATLSPLLKAHPDDPRLLKMLGFSLLQLRHLDEAVPVLQRVIERDSVDPGPRLALGRAYLYTGDFKRTIPLIEAELADDQDGSLHLQLARAYAGLGQKDKAESLRSRSQEMQRAADEKAREAAQRTITPPK